MSLACKCDRCGKLYERYRGTGYGDANGFQFCRMDFKGSIECRLAEKDLCTQCMEELKGWFNNELITVPKITYDDIYKDFIKNKRHGIEAGIWDWRPGKKAYTIRIWVIPEDGSPVKCQIYDYNTKELILEDPNHDSETSV